MVDVSKVKQQEEATRASQSNRQRLRSNTTKEKEDTSRIRMDVITPRVRWDSLARCPLFRETGNAAEAKGQSATFSEP